MKLCLGLIFCSECSTAAAISIPLYLINGPKILKKENMFLLNPAGTKVRRLPSGLSSRWRPVIAALAAAARLNKDRDYTAEEYLKAAVLGYAHLKEHNHYYLNDNQENIIDEYCALIASVELYKTTHQTCYLEEARTWAKRLTSRQQSDANVSHYWSANDDGSRPYFHAAEAGLPCNRTMRVSQHR